MGRGLSPTKKAHILHLLGLQKSIRAVAKEVACSPSTVHSVARGSNVTIADNRGGRPKSLTNREVKEVARALIGHDIHTATEARSLIHSRFGKSVHSTTISRALRATGMKAVVKKKKPLLTQRHRKLRLEFARKYASYTPADWKRVIWSDETKINRFQSDGRRWSWSKSSGGAGVLKDSEVSPTLKFGGGSLMMWGCMTSTGVGGFCRILGTMDADLYCEILRGELMDTLEAQNLDVTEVIYQQDNDPKHTSLKASKTLEDLGLEVLDWPAQSPDLNPIEELWRYLKIRLGRYPKPPEGIEELWVRVQKEWKDIPGNLISELVASMPRRIEAVLRAKGGHTKY
jgi:transposase